MMIERRIPFDNFRLQSVQKNYEVSVTDDKYDINYIHNGKSEKGGIEDHSDFDGSGQGS